MKTRFIEFGSPVKFAFMCEQLRPPHSADDLVKNSALYREFLARREEILKHKWIESEKEGRDIGFERALTDWIIKHSSNWRKNRQSNHRRSRADQN